MRKRQRAARLAARWNGEWNGDRRRKGGKHADIHPDIHADIHADIKGDANHAGQMYPNQSLHPGSSGQVQGGQVERAATRRQAQHPHGRPRQRTNPIVPVVGSGYALVTGGMVGSVDPQAPQRQVRWAAVLRVLVVLITVMGWIEVVVQGVSAVWWWLSNCLLHLAR